MATAFVVFGKKSGESLEDFIGEYNSVLAAQRAINVAKDCGYTDLRVLKHKDGDVPDFIGTTVV